MLQKEQRELAESSVDCDKRRYGGMRKVKTQGGLGNASESGKTTHDERRHIGWIALLAYMGLLVFLALHYGRSGDVPLWGLQDSRQLLLVIGGFALRGIFSFMFFIPVGVVATIALAGSLRGLPRLLTYPFALAIGGGMAVLVRIVEIGWSWRLYTAVGLILPLLACSFGMWIGATWLRGKRARVWLMPKIILWALLAVFCTGIFFLVSIEERPLPFPAAAVTSAEKRRLVHLIRSKSPRSLLEGQTQTLRLTEHDIDVLLSWGLLLGSPNRKARINLTRDSAALNASIGVPLGRGKTRYLNLIVAGDASMVEGALSLHMNRCRLGSLEIPRWLLKLLSPVATSVLRYNRLSGPFADALQEVAVETGAIQATYGPVHLPSHGFREGVFGSAVASEAMLASTRAQVNNLLAEVSQLPDGRPSFDMCVKTVFALARDRSEGRDPVAENRAGIFALGMLLGHDRVEEFLGPVRASREYGAARRMLNRVELRGRADWTKHFCVAAALVPLSDMAVSNAASLLKEELDADIGGSGFSFSDLCAAQCGAIFATKATRDKESARAMQGRLAQDFRVEDFFPPAADLPEGILDPELQSKYGGVGGEGYTHLIEEIERRIATCAGYQM